MVQRFENLVELCDASCSRYADRPLFGTRRSGSWSWLRYREFHERVERMRGGLSRLGVGAGDRVAIVSNNRVEWAVAAYGSYGLGAAFVPMYEVQHADEWAFILRDCGAKVVFAATPAIDEQLRAVAGELPALEHVIGIERPATDASSYAALLAGDAAPAIQPADDDIAGLVYTSGTTGKPKGVLLSHGNISSNINALHAVFVLDPSDRSLSFLPWAHSFGQTVELHALLSMGCSTAINDDIKRIVDNLGEVRPTVLIAVPRIFNRVYTAVQQQIAEKPAPVRALFSAALSRAKKKRLGQPLGALDRALLTLADKLIFESVRKKLGGRMVYAISGSAALDREVAEFVDALGIHVYEGYGLTETSPIVSANYPGHCKIGSVGKPLPGVDVSIDESKSERDGEGEVIVYGPNVMKGYHGRPDETAAAMTADGGLRTGDLGFVDEDGYLHITGRIKEQYKLENGKYVMPTPLEEQLKLSPYIANAMIYGDGRPFNVALIVPDGEMLARYTKEQSVHGEVQKNAEVRSLLAREIETHAASFKSFERPRAFGIVTEDFTAENGMLTPTLKLKRANILARYRPVIEELYQKRHDDAA